MKKVEPFFGLAAELLAAGLAEEANSYELPLAHWYDRVGHPTAELAMNLRFAAETEGDVLELAVGTGRVAIELAAAGKRVVGLDISVDMLSLCRQKADARGVSRRLILVEGDMCDFDLGRRFPLILIPNGSFIYVGTDAERLSLFKSVARHLTPGGTLVFSALAGEARPLSRPFLSHMEVDAETRSFMTQTAAFRRLTPYSQQVNLISTLVGPDGTRVWVDSSEEHTIAPDHLRRLLAEAGLTVRAMYSDYACSRYDAEAEDLIVVAGL